MSSMGRRATLLSAAVTLCFTAACEQDPYLVPNLSDGALLHLDGPQDGVHYEAWQPPDLTLDFYRGDLTFDGCLPQPEVCNNADDDCDGLVDEDLDKLSNPTYCENCAGCAQLLSANAIPGCALGKCTVAGCSSGFLDNDGDPKNGCEYECTPTGVEICDGKDNDCNGLIDDSLTIPQGYCRSLGACLGTVIACQGSLGWVCQYSQDVEMQPCATASDCGAGNSCQNNFCTNLVIVDEQRCDGIDGDCDGKIDDPWTTQGSPTAIGEECEVDNPPLKGVCRNLGTYACAASTSGVECKQTTPGQPATAELCNGLDDDCDGVIDNDVSDEIWVDVVSGSVFKIFRYEASRPDATSTQAGISSEGRPCSVPGRLPWAAISREDAQAACVRAGGRLCTTAEWTAACRGQAFTLYPYGNTFLPDSCNGRAYDPKPSTGTNEDEAVPTDQPQSCTSNWGAAGSLNNMSGNLKEWVATTFSGNTPNGFEIKGGAYDTPSVDAYGAGLSCDYQLPAPGSCTKDSHCEGANTCDDKICSHMINFQLPSLGFRCCK